MKKSLHLLLLFIFPIIINAQTTAPTTQVSPKWRIGDVKKITASETTKMYINDTLIMDQTMTTNSTVKVVSADQTHYKINFSTKSNQLLLEFDKQIAEADSLNKEILTMYKDLVNKLSSVIYIMMINKETGLAEKLVNGDDVLIKMNTTVNEVLNTLANKMNATPQERAELDKEMSKFFRKNKEDIEQTILNNFNLIFQAHSYTFPLNGSETQEVMAYNPNLLDKTGLEEFPVVMTITSVQKPNMILLTIDNVYKKEDLLNALKKANPEYKNLQINEISIVDKENISFNTLTNWISSYKNQSEVILPSMKIISSTNISIQ